jgi:hypothetical protein
MPPDALISYKGANSAISEHLPARYWDIYARNNIPAVYEGNFIKNPRDIMPPDAISYKDANSAIWEHLPA